MKTLLSLKTIRFIVLIFSILITGKLSAQATITSTTDGGNWAIDTTWVGGVVPTSLDDVIIAAGASVTLRSPYVFSAPALVNSLTIDGTLTMGSGSSSPRYLEIATFLLINAGGTLTNDGTIIHYVSVGENYTNNGTFTSSVNVGAIHIYFEGTGTQVINGTSTQNFNTIVIDKPSGQVEVDASVATLNVASFTIASGDFIAPSVLEISGNYTCNDLDAFQAGAGTVVFNGTSQTIGGTVTTTFNNVTGMGNTVIANTRTTIINGNFTLTNGATFNVAGFDFTVNGETAIGNGSAGNLTFTSTSNTKVFAGKVTISANGNWNNSIGENVTLRNGLSNMGTLTSGTGTYFITTNSQSFDGTISLDKAEVSAALTNNGTLSVVTSLSGAGSLVQGTNATLNIGGTSTITTLTATASGNTVNYNGGVQTLKGITYVNLGLSGTDASHVKTLSSATTSILGNLSLSGITSTSTVATIVIGGQLNISSGATFTMAGDGVTVTGPTNVGSNGTLVFSSTIGTKTFIGPVTIDGLWNNTANENVHFQSGLTNNGTFNAGTGIYRFAVSSQAIGGSFAVTTIDVLTGVTLTNNGTLTVSSDLGGLGTFVQGANSVLNLDGTVSIASFDPSGVNNTVNYSGGAQTIRGLNYVGLSLMGTGVKTLESGTTNISGSVTLGGSASVSTVVDLTIGGNLAISPGTSLTNNHTLTVSGLLLGLGGLTQSANSTLNINGDAQLASINASASGNEVNYYAASPSIIPGSYYNLNVDQASGDAILYGAVTVGGTLSLTGNLDIGNHHLTISEPADISIASPSETNMIITSGSGELRKVFSALGSFTFPVGEINGTAEYSPITVEVSSAGSFTSAYIGVSVVDAKHPNNNSNTDFLTRYWTVSQSGISSCEISATGTYLNSDVSGTEANIVAGQLAGVFNQIANGWKKYSSISSNTLVATGSLISSGQTSAFTGISGVITTVAITGGDNAEPVCVGTPVQLGATVTGEGTIVYSWSPSEGLSATDIANPSAQPTSTKTYTLTIYDENGVSATDNTTITTFQPAKPTITPSDLTTENPKLTSSSATGNQWFKNGSSIGGATGQMLSVTENGSYTVQVTSNGCASPVSEAYVIVIVGLGEDNIVGNAGIYPNPAHDVIQFDRSRFVPGDEIEVKLYDMMGRLKVNKVLKETEDALDISSLSKGQHIFVAAQKNRLVIQKFIKN
jgi:hypothetical protein